MSIKIKAYRLENFKRVREVSFEPEDCGLFVIGGKNRCGKTSSLDGIPWLLGGAKFAPSNPKNESAIGNIYGSITLSNGIVVERGGKNGTLKVTDPSRAKAGQELLNEFVSALALDLPKFLHASDKEKAMILLETLGIKEKLDDLDDKEKRLYDERTEIGRVALSMRKHADEMPFYHDAPTIELSAAEIITRQQEAISHNNANNECRRQKESAETLLQVYRRQIQEYSSATDAKAEELKQLRERYERKYADVETWERKNIGNDLRLKITEAFAEARLEAEKLSGYYDLSMVIGSIEQTISNLSRAVDKHEETLSRIKQECAEVYNCRIVPLESELDLRDKKMIEAAKKTKEAEENCKILSDKVDQLPLDIDLAIFKADIEKLESENAKFRANAAHDKASAEASEKEGEYEAFTQKIEAIRRERMQLLSSVKMPLPSLTVKDSLLYYSGQRWDCMSGSEQLIVATSIVRAVKPECGFVLMDQLEAMDIDTLEEFNGWLKKENLQVIATRVSSGSECSIIIEDGMLQK